MRHQTACLLCSVPLPDCDQWCWHVSYHSGYRLSPGYLLCTLTIVDAGPTNHLYKYQYQLARMCVQMSVSELSQHIVSCFKPRSFASQNSMAPCAIIPGILHQCKAFEDTCAVCESKALPQQLASFLGLGHWGARRAGHKKEWWGIRPHSPYLQIFIPEPACTAAGCPLSWTAWTDAHCLCLASLHHQGCRQSMCLPV